MFATSPYGHCCHYQRLHHHHRHRHPHHQGSEVGNVEQGKEEDSGAKQTISDSWQETDVTLKWGDLEVNLIKK